jgi:polysaccharide deacetylase 2 family uncharacterized protein YibQ
MAGNDRTMDRRAFLFRSASFLVGGLLGLDRFSKAYAFWELKDLSHFQPRMALIIDDIGRSRSSARRFLELGVPMTFAILPRLGKSHDLGIEIHAEGHEIMLHQPMEPYASDIDPGPGALYVGDGPKRILRIMEENISGLPFFTGVNNHMGSRFTACQREMTEVLEVIKEKDLFFIDSLTTSRSKAYKTARSLRITTACRNIFLDNHLQVPAILSQLRKLQRHALKYGYAIGIGHPFQETARAIGQFLKGPKDSRTSLVYISDLLPI